MKKIIYIDESGTGGRNSKNPYFVLTACIIDDKDYDKIKRIIKKTRTSPKFRKKISHLPELKFSNTNPEIREHIFNQLIKFNIEVHTIYIDNKKTYSRIHENGGIPNIYNRLVINLLGDIIESLEIPFEIILDRCLSKSQIEKFQKDINQYFKGPEIIHKNSEEEPLLQIVDFLCGAFGYKFNSNREDNNRYVNIIKNIIVKERKFY
ncbi:MAG: DUF3800 domain-containing protein [Nanoarchaeota archaeon]|nr:DUF3800 domain-containing protein [Nanoarchaeota archaeon]